MHSQITFAAKAVNPIHSHTIVIVGAGFSGTVLATRLLRTVAPQTQLILVEQGPEHGRGVAYTKRDYPYLLNVPAARMSADSRDPLQFVRFAKRRDPSVEGEHFLPREVYGDYLESCLLAARRSAPGGVSLSRITAQARRIVPQGSDQRLRVELSSGVVLNADDVVLATGNPPPASLPCEDDVRKHPAYFDNPWSLNVDFSPWQKVLIVGTGLSMADAVMQFQASASGSPRLHAISRHGLLPLAQSTPRNTVLSGSDVPLQQEAHSLRKLTRTVISLAAAVEEAGGEWHEVVALLRPLSPTIWAALADTERRRFLRHVQPYWDIHRHCLPAFIAEHLQELRQSGQLQITAGRIEWLQTSGEQIRVAWRPRGDAAIQEATFDGVINAIGPDYRLRTARDPLHRSLFESGIVTADPHSLGIRTDAHCAVIGVNDQPHPHLYYLGPMLRAAHWEATAVPELRGHAERLAAQLAARQQQWATQ